MNNSCTFFEGVNAVEVDEMVEDRGTTLQENMGYGCYFIKYKLRWDGVKIAISNTT